MVHSCSDWGGRGKGSVEPGMLQGGGNSTNPRLQKILKFGQVLTADWSGCGASLLEANVLRSMPWEISEASGYSPASVRRLTHKGLIPGTIPPGKAGGHFRYRCGPVLSHWLKISRALNAGRKEIPETMETGSPECRPMPHRSPAAAEKGRGTARLTLEEERNAQIELSRLHAALVHVPADDFIMWSLMYELAMRRLEEPDAECVVQNWPHPKLRALRRVHKTALAAIGQYASTCNKSDLIRLVTSLLLVRRGPGPRPGERSPRNPEPPAPSPG